MLGGVTRHMLPLLPGVPHLHVNRHLLVKKILISSTFNGHIAWYLRLKKVCVRDMHNTVS